MSVVLNVLALDRTVSGSFGSASKCGDARRRVFRRSRCTGRAFRRQAAEQMGTTPENAERRVIATMRRDRIAEKSCWMGLALIRDRSDAVEVEPGAWS